MNHPSAPPAFSSKPRSRKPADASGSHASRAPTAARLRKESAILTEAENQFAQFGFEGASLENIAVAVGMSRHNLLYYYPSKEALYRCVLDDVLTLWLEGLSELSDTDDPQQALRQYIRSKLRSSFERPNSTKMFTKEMIAGAPRYSDAITNRVAPLLKAKVKMFQRWARQGKINRVDFTHLMFIIWSVTQAYADQQTQFALLLGKTKLEQKDFDQAEELIMTMVWSSLQVRPGADDVGT